MQIKKKKLKPQNQKDAKAEEYLGEDGMRM
jgi:hypothetical protein